MMAININTLKERFEAKFTKGAENECWIWQASKSPFGYGQINVNGRCRLSNRVSYQLYVGEIPDGMCVLHRCDCPSCVNISHLFLGTKKDNNQDRANKGRNIDNAGEKHPRAKVTIKEVLEIRSSTDTIRKLAKAYGLSPRGIRSIRNRDSWKCVARVKTDLSVSQMRHNKKLTADDVIAIRASSESARIIAKVYGVNPPAIYKIRAGERWKHVGEGAQNV